MIKLHSDIQKISITLISKQHEISKKWEDLHQIFIGDETKNLENTIDGGFIIGTYGGTLHKTDSNFNIGATMNIDKDIRKKESFSLLENFPNPFNPKTTITYFINHHGVVFINIYDINGLKIKSLKSSQLTRNEYNEIKWNDIKNLSPGLYYAEVIFENRNSELIKLAIIQ